MDPLLEGVQRRFEFASEARVGRSWAPDAPTMMAGKLVCLLLEPCCGLQYWLVAARGAWRWICDAWCGASRAGVHAWMQRVMRGCAYVMHGAAHGARRCICGAWVQVYRCASE